MTRVKHPCVKTLSSEEQESKAILEREEEAIVDWLFEHSDDKEFGAMVSRLHEVGKKILDIEGKSPLDVNSDFRR